MPMLSLRKEQVARSLLKMTLDQLSQLGPS